VALFVLSPRKATVARFRAAAAVGKLAELWSRGDSGIHTY
jgi:hypothetical protein